MPQLPTCLIAKFPGPVYGAAEALMSEEQQWEENFSFGLFLSLFLCCFLVAHARFRLYTQQIVEECRARLSQSTASG